MKPPTPLRPGAILLECVLALTIFVGGGLAVLSLIDRATDSIMSVRSAQTAADIAASAIAGIEAGVLAPESLRGEVTEWMDPDGRWTESARWSDWSVEVETEPEPLDGLTSVTVKVYRGFVGSETPAIYELRQTVSLRPPAADTPGPEDPLAVQLNDGGAR